MKESLLLKVLIIGWLTLAQGIHFCREHQLLNKFIDKAFSYAGAH